MNHGDGGGGPGGGGGGEAKGEFNVVAEGEHVGPGWASAEPGGAVNEQAWTNTPGHRIAAGGQGAGLVEVLAHGTEGAGKGPGDGFGGFLELAGGID
jgi:hypothetical protein